MLRAGRAGSEEMEGLHKMTTRTLAGGIGFLAAVVVPVCFAVRCIQMVGIQGFSYEAAAREVEKLPTYLLVTTVAPDLLWALVLAFFWVLAATLVTAGVGKAVPLSTAIAAMRSIGRFVLGGTKTGCAVLAVLVLAALSAWVSMVLYAGAVELIWILRTLFLGCVVAGTWAGMSLVRDLPEGTRRRLDRVQALTLTLAVFCYAGQDPSAWLAS